MDEVDSGGWMRAKKSVKNVGHWSAYVQRKKRVRVCANLLRKTARHMRIKRGGYEGGQYSHEAADSAVPKIYYD